ncbi:MAG TPA: GNAT family N-acetyltransferase [Chloroflexota bacterium]|nr:GNAT family N-acetyltransferase [Chloroflexota bacterium]
MLLGDLSLARQVYGNFRAMWEAVGGVAGPDGVFEVTRRVDMLFIRSLMVQRVPHMVIDPQVEDAAAPAWAAGLVRGMTGQAGSLMVSMPPGREEGPLAGALRREGFTTGSPAPIFMVRFGTPRLPDFDDPDIVLADAEPRLSVARELLGKVFGLPREVFAFYTPPALVNTYVLQHNGKAMAAACLCPFVGTAGIYSVGVLPGARGRGYARRLVWQALRDAERLGLDLAVLSCDPSLAPLYQKAGFQECWHSATLWLEPWWR